MAFPLRVIMIKVLGSGVQDGVIVKKCDIPGFHHEIEPEFRAMGNFFEQVKCPGLKNGFFPLQFLPSLLHLDC